MAKTRRLTKWFMRLLKLPPQLIYKLGLGPVYGRLVLLLTTTGRKSGKPRVTPLQYEEIDGALYIASARGTKADWFQNILADPRVSIQVGSRKFQGQAEPVTDPVRIADFLEFRLQRSPRMIGTLMRFEGLPAEATRAELEAFASEKAIVIISPEH
jgi:deazaflavin-dependent oxidoreductase (nitroreductase family)